MKILSEFRNLIPPLSHDELTTLEQSILSEGVRDALVVGRWPDPDTGELTEVLIDGHNRYEIATEHGKPFNIVYRDFDGYISAKAWMITNQFGRRNISNYQRSVLALQLEGLFREKGKQNQRGGRGGVLLSTGEEDFRPVDTKKELARIAAVSHDTIAKVKKIEHKGSDEMKQQLLRGEISINEAYKQVRDEQAEPDESTANSEESLEFIPEADRVLIEQMKAGRTVVINTYKNFHALRYARDEGIFVAIDKTSDWANPFLMGQDGNRDEICDKYEIFYGLKTSLHNKIRGLRGKALGCHCYPQRCHGDFLKKKSEET
ncbi:MAG: hypothetical protein RJA20_1083 [Bacteroidota bacterium]|jgi:hypothetical protein